LTLEECKKAIEGKDKAKAKKRKKSIDGKVKAKSKKREKTDSDKTNSAPSLEIPKDWINPFNKL